MITVIVVLGGISLDECFVSLKHFNNFKRRISDVSI